MEYFLVVPSSLVLKPVSRQLHSPIKPLFSPSSRHGYVSAEMDIPVKIFKSLRAERIRLGGMPGLREAAVA
jgi:hypothetical protein